MAVDREELIVRLLSIAADPDRPVPYRHLAVEQARLLQRHGGNVEEAAAAAAEWKGKTWDAARTETMRQYLPWLWQTPILPPSAELLRAQRRAAVRRWALPTAAAAAVAAVGGWWLVTR